jgi:malate dehydrogenase (oxaloacetate-decarboxylating)
MEGKALLFKLLGGVDAVPLCVAPRDEAALVDLVRALEPSFGGVNLEDIAQPKCFRVLERLRASMTIPVWHDDQQGSATALLAGLLNALAVVGKRLDRVRIALVGMGAANVSTYRLLKAAGVAPHSVVACDSKGILHPARTDLEGFAAKRRVAEETAPERAGGVAEALAGTDVCVAFTRSGPGIIEPRWISGMAANAIVMACANPVPEIWPDEAMAAGARIVATGRGDLPNQVNNALVFPGLFRGVLDIRARRITDGMALAAARELAAIRVEAGLDEHHILPALDDATVAPRVAAAAAAAAVAEGTAEGPFEREAFIARARDTIADVRAAVARLLRTP